MADHTVNAMLSAVRSMREVVIPALDPAHPLAREQAGLVVKYLEFWAERVDRLGERNRAELAAYTGMGLALLEPAREISPGLHAELVDQLATADALLSGQHADVASLRGCVGALTRAITALVRTADAEQHSAAERVGRVVVRHSSSVALLQRAWFGPQRWEDPLPPPLDQVLAEQVPEGRPR